ncbi:transglutaminase family protein [Bacterioplanoides pacificum]|uniref:TransglutaminaseTgpA domain-containing protein n=1 Tax=Bacterioplanoides pacificum TaxID=1171596 RepID=A0ABV7VV14_9GAMM
MINRQQTFFWFALQLACASGGAIAALLTPALGWLAALVTLPASYITLRLGWKARQQPLDNKPLADGLAALGIAVFIVLLFVSGLMPALTLLLLFATLALNTQMNSYRKFYLAQLISFVFLLIGAAEAHSGHYLLLMALYVVFAAFALTEAWLDQDNTGQPVTGPGHRQRLQLAAVTVALAFVIYLLIPRLPALNWGAQQASASDFYHNQQWQKEARSGSPSTSQPAAEHSRPGDLDQAREQKNQQLQQITQLSRAETPDGDPSYRYPGFNEQFDIRDPSRGGAIDLFAIVARMQASHGGYLKVRTFDHFDGLSWSTANEDISRKLSAGPSGKFRLQDDKAGNFQHIIQIEAPLPAWLPVAADPVSLWLPASAIALDQFDQPLLPGALQPGTRYTVLSQLHTLDNRPISHAPRPTPQDRQLPTDFDPRITQLARTTTQQAHDPFSQALLLEQHLRSQYQYDFNAILDSQGRTPLSRFLFETQQGHCEYFASAMVMMLRSLDIPARLVTGFSATSRNPLTGYFEIRAIDGHAWVEAWIDNRWLTFEPTAFYQLPQRSHSYSSAEQIQQYAQQLIRLDEVNHNGEFSLSAWLSRIWNILYTLLISLVALLQLLLWPLCILALLTLAGWLSRRWWQPPVLAAVGRWRLRRFRPEAQDDATRVLKYCLSQLQLMCYQTPRLPGQPLEQWIARLQQQHPQASGLESLAEQVQQVFYYQQPLDRGRLQTTLTTLLNTL